MKKMAGDIYLYIYIRTINEDHMIYGYWNIRCDRQKFSTFWAIFCPFSPLTTWEIKILTLKKTTGDIITLHIYIINYNHMMYGSWDKEHGRHNFLSFWTVFSPFIPLRTQKIKIKKKWKKHLRYHHFTNINDSHMMYGSSDMVCNGQNFLSFWTIFCPFTPLTTQKIKILKTWKNCLEILSFYTCAT